MRLPRPHTRSDGLEWALAAIVLGIGVGEAAGLWHGSAPGAPADRASAGPSRRWRCCGRARWRGPTPRRTRNRPW